MRAKHVPHGQTRSPAYAWAARYANQLRGKSHAWLSAAVTERRLKASMPQLPAPRAHGGAATGQEEMAADQLLRLYQATLQAIQDLGITPGIGAELSRDMLRVFSTSTGETIGYYYTAEGAGWMWTELPNIMRPSFSVEWTYGIPQFHELIINPVIQAVTDAAYVAQAEGGDILDALSASLDDIGAASILVFMSGAF